MLYTSYKTSLVSVKVHLIPVRQQKRVRTNAHQYQVGVPANRSTFAEIIMSL